YRGRGERAARRCASARAPWMGSGCAMALVRGRRGRPGSDSRGGNRRFGRGGHTYRGDLRVGRGLAPLPVGSRLDATSGWFTWAPGVGFVGAYDLVFVRWAGTRAVARHEVRLILAPKGRGHVGVQ